MTDTSAAIATPAQKAPSRRGFLGQLLRNPTGATAIAILVIIILSCVFANVLAPYDPLHQDLLAVKQTPSGAHLLGTDTLGRDVLSRILFGGRSALLGVVVAIVVWLIVGVILGVLAGYLGGWVDRVISAIVDLVMSLPSIVLVLAVLAMFERSLTASMIAQGLLSAGGLVRVVRAATMSVRGELYVTSARVAGLGDLRILIRHVLPGLVGPIVIQLGLFAGGALTIQAGLGFLDLGVPPPAPTWGGMIGEAAQVIDQFPWLLIPSGGIIAITILALGLMGDAARDVVSASRRTPSGRRQRTQVIEPAATKDAARESQSGDTVLEVQDLSVQFGGTSEPAVDGISFTVAKGEIAGLVGESGSGKTVTSLALLGLLPGHAQVSAAQLRAGDLHLLGASEKTLTRYRGSEIAYVSQEPMVSLDPSFTVGSLMAEVLRRHRHGITAREIHDRSIAMMERVHLPDPEGVLHKYPFELSGGMAQRIVIAMALVGDPKVLIADEPTTALDVTVQAEILDLLRELRSTLGMAIVLVTHDLGVVADICDRVMVMKSGHIVEEAPVEQLFASPADSYTKRLLAATPNFLAESQRSSDV